VLSLQLSFAVVPLVTFTSQRSRMGEFVNPPWVVALAALVTLLIVGLNAKLVGDVVSGAWAATGGAWWIAALVVPAIAAVGLLLVGVAAMPLLRRLELAPLPSRRLPVPPEFATRVPAAPGEVRAVAATGARRVAVALELGWADTAVLEHVQGMALPRDAEIRLMHVAESAASRYLGTESSDEETREDTATLEDLAGRLRAAGFRTSVLLGNGDVKLELARMVREWDADLLVTGSHGHRLLGDLFLGSTASGLRHRVRCPVLTIRSRRA